LKVDGHQQCCAVLYEHGNFGGWKAYFPPGEYDVNKMQAKGAKNDQVSSLKVVADGCP